MRKQQQQYIGLPVIAYCIHFVTTFTTFCCKQLQRFFTPTVHSLPLCYLSHHFQRSIFISIEVREQKSGYGTRCLNSHPGYVRACLLFTYIGAVQSRMKRVPGTFLWEYAVTFCSIINIKGRKLWGHSLIFIHCLKLGLKSEMTTT